MQKRSCTGEAIIFGRDYETFYAPLIDEGGELKGIELPTGDDEGPERHARVTSRNSFCDPIHRSK